MKAVITSKFSQLHLFKILFTVTSPAGYEQQRILPLRFSPQTAAERAAGGA